MTWQPLPDPSAQGPFSGHDKAAEATDPYIATAVALSTPDHAGAAEMTKTFIVEFALMGWPRQKIERMFRIPRYVAAYAVYRARGPEFVAEMIDDVLGPATGEEA